ncbi:hypothetical protein [Ruminococcus sp.]|uniref:hypothetical protein n=1 Tax=Ruminococcus sp. TaxID=41978 RepID=UPI0025D9C8F9|nr:hypothetical protein [Ruminococcus sp.]MBQ8965032.1 hypothetical protein [Ruminococcus sp.]
MIFIWHNGEDISLTLRFGSALSGKHRFALKHSRQHYAGGMSMLTETQLLVRYQHELHKLRTEK